MACVKTTRPFLTGAFWAILLVSTLLIDVVYAFFTMTIHVRAALILTIFLYTYIALLTGIWFALTAAAEQMSAMNVGAAAFWWSGSLIIFFWFFSHALLAPLGGGFAGCPLINPLLALIPHALFAQFIRTTGFFIPMAFIFVPALCAYLLRLYLLPLFIGGIIMVTLVGDAWLHPTTQYPAWLSCIVWMPYIFPAASDERALVSCVIHQAQRTSVDADFAPLCFIMPESSIEGCHESLLYDLARAWLVLCPRAQLIIGGICYTRHEQRLNVVFSCTDNQTPMIYAKCTPIPCVECIPRCVQRWLRHEYFYGDHKNIHQADTHRVPFAVHNHISLVPYICSEFLCAAYPDDRHPDLPILALCNDRWCLFAATKKGLVAIARYKAAAWHRAVLYIAYSRACYIDQYGTLWDLA